MKKTPRSFLLSSLLTLALATPLLSQDQDQDPPEPQAPQQTEDAEMAAAEQAYKDFISSLDWKTEITVDLGARATLSIPTNYMFLGASDTQKIMEFYGNLINGNELGYISPADMSWFAVFEFGDVGYVKDDEKNDLNADEILDQLKQGQEHANTELQSRGMDTLQVVGWHTPPFYNQNTKNLEWAIKLSTSSGGEIINYKTKILGRKGVMDIVLVCGEGQLATVIPVYQEILTKFSYKQEESYAAYEKGDKIAEYGLIGLIAGGGLLVAAKTGLLAKLWKPIAIGLLAIGAFFKRLIKGKNADNI